MKSDLLFMMKLIASAVLEKEYPVVPENVNWAKILQISVMHNIANIVAYGILNGKYEVAQEIKAQFELKLYERLTVSGNQNAEINKLLKAFSENEIDYMPFKGIILQNLYPTADMRFMADADILIKKEQFDKINQVMLDLGYTFTEEGPIEYNYVKKPYMHMEIHKDIIAPSSEDLFEYYRDCWKFANKTETPYRYEMGIEDHFIFNFNHFVRHYRDAGVGIKGVIDLWIYMKKYPDMNIDYIYSELDRLNMRTFFDNLIRLSQFWFEDGKSDLVLEQMTEFIVSSGTFGTLKNKISAKAIRDNSDIKKSEKFKYFRFIFPKLKQMKVIFPVLEKLPILLPFLWIWRVIRFVLFRRKKIEAHMQYVENIDTDSIILYDAHMSTVGLDMSNGRKKR